VHSAQDYDRRGFFGKGEPRKDFFPVFSRAAGNGSTAAAPVRPVPRRAFCVAKIAFRPGLLQLRDPRPGAVFVLLRGAAADAASALDDAVAHNRDSPLTHDHVAARGGGNAARGRLVGALG